MFCKRNPMEVLRSETSHIHTSVTSRRVHCNTLHFVIHFLINYFTLCSHINYFLTFFIIVGSERYVVQYLFNRLATHSKPVKKKRKVWQSTHRSTDNKISILDRINATTLSDTTKMTEKWNDRVRQRKRHKGHKKAIYL